MMPKALYICVKNIVATHIVTYNEGEDSHDDGIWTWPGLADAFSVSGPNFHASAFRTADLEFDTYLYKR